MNIYKKFLGTIASVMIIMAANGAQAETLQDAVKFMLLSNPEVRAQSYNRMAKDKEVRQAKAGYLPTIDVTSGIGFDRQHQPFYDTTYPHSTKISIRQNVFRFFGTQSEVERQEARVKSQAYLLHGTTESNALLAARSYLNVLRYQELYTLAQENLANHQRILDQVKLRSESGIDRKADLDQVMGRLALAQSNITAAEANLADANSDYLAIIGHLPGELVKPDDAGSALPGTLEEAEQLAIKNNPVVKSSKADIEARKAQHETAKSQLYPSLDVAMDYKWEKDVSIPGKQSGFLAMGILSFNIFNGGWNRARIGQTALEIYEAEEISNNATRQTVQSVRLSWEAYRATKERAISLEEYAKSAGMTAEAFAAQWNIGRRTMFDLLDTQAEHINARASLTNVKYDKLIAEYRILSVMAKLIPHLGLPLPEQSIVPMGK